MGKFIDMTGWVMSEHGVADSKLTVLQWHKAEANHPGRWECVCSCGNPNHVFVAGNALRTGFTKSCGCFRIDDLNGKHFGHLEVIQLDSSKKTGSGKHAYWLCKCDLCDNIVSVRSSDLKNGKSDCGCMTRYKNSLAHLKDYTGQCFGHLHVLYRDMTIGHKSGRHAAWVCYCDKCGSIESIPSDALMDGKDRCSKCVNMSIGEARIMDILDEHKILYKHNTTYQDCKNPNTGGYLRFDFRIMLNDTDISHVIEYDGEQHFRNAPGWDERYSLEERQYLDTVKTEWCKLHHIPIIRIPYKHLNKICLDDLLLDTTSFRVA